MNKYFLPFVATLSFAASSALAESPWRVPSHFEITTNTGVGYSMFVVGSHPDLGEWNPLRAIPLAWHNGNVWSADIGLRAGADLPSGETTGYKFVKRPTDAASFPNDQNTEWSSGPNLSTNVPAEQDASFSGKRVIFLHDWPEPVYLWYTTLSKPDFDATTEWVTNALMTKTGPGRYEIDGVSEPGEWMRFTFCHPIDGKDPNDWEWYHFDHTGDDFWSPLDAFCIRDHQVFNYEPATGVSDSRIVDVEVGSSYPSIAGRTVRVYLPRGFDENTSRRYPVLYFADGQQIFSDREASWGGWGVDTAADREIRGGRMREAILVGVPCRTEPIPGTTQEQAAYARLWEYLPGTDYLMGSPQLLGRELWGLGTDYANFLIHNVRPTIDYNVCKDRTFNDRANTGHVGSSAGGLLSFFLGTYTNVFGLVGAVSGVYNEEYIPNFRNWCTNNLSHIGTNDIKRIWLDTGTEETDIEQLNLYASNWEALNTLLYAGHVQNKTLHFGVYHSSLDEYGNYDYAGEHNEKAWAARSADILRFLLPVTDEFNPLLPIELSPAGNGAIAYPLYPGAANELVRLDSLLPIHTNSVVPLDASTDKPWDTDTFVPDDAGFYFIRSKPSP